MRGLDAGIWVCLECEQANQVTNPELNKIACRRCGAAVWSRRPASLLRTWALLLTAALLYVPANVLPIMTVHSFGKGTPDTIMSGVLTLINNDMVPIAMVVFFASILVPTFKLIGLAVLLYSVQRHLQMSARQRIAMYRFIEWIGRWSMLDIFVIAILVTLVRFENLANIDAGIGAMAFASVVILTMLAALTFDPRLIWDNAQTESRNE